MKLYIAGPITGVPDGNTPAFNEAAKQLREAGYDVSNPADHGYGTRPWKWYMVKALKMMLDCDAVALLPGYSNSKGARLEVQVAHAMDMKTKYVEAWLEDAV